MSNTPDFVKHALNQRKTDHQFRSLSIWNPKGKATVQSVDEQKLINFSSNDYLGLATHPKVIDKSRKYLKTYGSGSTASRLITGNFEIHEQLENNIASALNREAALVFNSGFQANSTILSTVTDRHSLILADKRSHYSLLQGAFSSRATFQRFKHNDTNHLEKLLKKAQDQQYNRVWIVTESIFSMDGDRSSLQDIASLAQQYEAFLFADDAHAVGVWGENGFGLAQDIPEVDLLLGTCGKAFGSFGAYVACSHQMREYLINFCPGFIYTTALPPAVIGATEAALELIPTMDDERETHHQQIAEFRSALQAMGYETGPSSTQIVPVIVGEEKETIELSKYLMINGFLATAVRPPTVPAESSRLRFTLSASHTDEQLQELLNALNDWNNE